MVGPMAEARLRGTLVTLAAAVGGEAFFEPVLALAEGLAVDVEVEGDAVVFDRLVVGVLYPQLDHEAHFHALPRQGFQADQVDTQRIALAEGAAGAQQDAQAQGRQQAAGELLAELHPPLVEGVDPPDDALNEYFMLIERQQHP